METVAELRRPGRVGTLAGHSCGVVAPAGRAVVTEQKRARQTVEYGSLVAVVRNDSWLQLPLDQFAQTKNRYRRQRCWYYMGLGGYGYSMEPLVEPNLVVPAGIARMANCDAAGDCGWECVVKDTVLDVEIDVESLVDAELHRILDAADVAAVVSRDGGDARANQDSKQLQLMLGHQAVKA